METLTQEKLAEFFDVTRQTISNWKQEDKKTVIKFAYKYLDDEKIDEFVKTGEISQFEQNLFDEFSNLQEFLLEKKALDVYEHFRNIENFAIKTIFSDFIEKTHYQIPAKDINDFVKNVAFIKDDFYEKFTTFLYENKNKYEVYDRRNANSFAEFILSQEEIYLYYSLKFLYLLRFYQMEKFEFEVKKFGFLKAVINTFFK